MLTLVLTAANLAYGQSNTLVLQPTDVPFGQQTTIGSPAAFLHQPPGADILFVFFETQLSGATTACPAGEWGLGLAYTFDGTNWSIVNFPLVQPTADTYYSCVAAHPAVVPLAGGNSWVVYFKAEQDPASCPGTATWDCADRYTGLGRLVVSYTGTSGGSYNYNLSAVDSTPVMTDVAQDMGYPSVVFADGEYHMAFAQNPDVYVASSPFNSNFTVPTSPSLTANSSATGWDRDELFSPSLLCTSPTDFALAVGGRVWDPYPTLADQSVGVYTTSDFTTWTEQPPLLHNRSSDGFEVRHLDVTTAGSLANTGIFYTRPGTGGNELWLSTTAGWTHDTVDEKRCP